MKRSKRLNVYVEKFQKSDFVKSGKLLIFVISILFALNWVSTFALGFLALYSIPFALQIGLWLAIPIILMFLTLEFNKKIAYQIVIAIVAASIFMQLHHLHNSYEFLIKYGDDAQKWCSCDPIADMINNIKGTVLNLLLIYLLHQPALKNRFKLNKKTLTNSILGGLLMFVVNFMK